MFSLVSVCPLEGGMPTEGGLPHGDPPLMTFSGGQPLQRSVRFLLECILVHLILFYHTGKFNCKFQFSALQCEKSCLFHVQ